MPLLTPIDVINAACARIGEEPLQSFSDETDIAQSANLIYEEVVGFNLSLQPSGFGFAREYRQLSKLTSDPPFSGFNYIFEVPGPKIGLPTYLTDDPTDPNSRYTQFIITNGRVHADDDPLFAMVKFIPSPHLWTATFLSATITAIAGHMAFAIASDRTTRGELLRDAYGTPTENYRGGLMRTALSEDAFANPPRSIDTGNNPLENAWRSG